jgi:hypothetical protein
MFTAIHASEDVVAAREKAIRVIEKLRVSRLTKAAGLAEAGVEETLELPRFPGGALAAYPHEQFARASGARDQAPHARGRRPREVSVTLR